MISDSDTDINIIRINNKTKFSSQFQAKIKKEVDGGM